MTTAAPPAGSGSRASGGKATQTPAAVKDPGPPDPATATQEQWLARELWELHHPDGDRDGYTVEQLAALGGQDGWPALTAAKVRRLIAVEEERQRTLAGAKRAGGPPAAARQAGNPRRRRQAA